jgi:hypothetical protein
MSIKLEGIIMSVGRAEGRWRGIVSAKDALASSGEIDSALYLAIDGM